MIMCVSRTTIYFNCIRVQLHLFKCKYTRIITYDYMCRNVKTNFMYNHFFLEYYTYRDFL